MKFTKCVARPTRILIAKLLRGGRPPGDAVQARSHNAAAAQGRTDWGVAIDTVARMYDLSFLPLQSEHYDFVIPADCWDRPAVLQFRRLLADEPTRARLRDLGFRFDGTGSLRIHSGGTT